MPIRSNHRFKPHPLGKQAVEREIGQLQQPTQTRPGSRQDRTGRKEPGRRVPTTNRSDGQERTKPDGRPDRSRCGRLLFPRKRQARRVGHRVRARRVNGFQSQMGSEQIVGCVKRTSVDNHRPFGGAFHAPYSTRLNRVERRERGGKRTGKFRFGTAGKASKQCVPTRSVRTRSIYKHNKHTPRQSQGLLPLERVFWIGENIFWTAG